VGGFRPTFGIAVIEVPARVGAGLQQHSHALDVFAADRRGERHPGDLAYVRGAAEQQPQGLMIISEAGQVQVIVIGHRAPVDQQPRDLGIRRASDRALQRLPAAARDHPVGIRPGIEQQPDHRDKPVLAAGVEPAPLRRAGGVQRGPSRRGVGACHQAGVSFERGPNPIHVAEHHGRRQVVAGKLWSRRQHPGRATGPVPDACPAELVG
jgi:hypothetical protein